MKWVTFRFHWHTSAPFPLKDPIPISISISNPTRNPPPPRPTPLAIRRITAAASSGSDITEIRVCTSRTCRRQGSFQIHETLVGIAPPNVSVKTCGCLGLCGAGPNLVALPAAVMVCHCGTPARAADLMVELCGGSGREEGMPDGLKCLEALGLRKRAEIEIDSGNSAEAESLLSKAIDIGPFGGVYIVYKIRSAVRCQKNDFFGALEDAEQALKLAPEYAEAYICQGDAFFGMGLFDKAEESYSMAIVRDSSIHRSKSFKARIAKLQEKLASIATA